MASGRFSFKKGVHHLTNWTVALALIPVVWAVFHHVGKMGVRLVSEGVSSWWRYAAGAGVYLVFERLLFKPMWLYVFGHEMTHAVSGLLSGARIHSFKAGSKGGEVRLSKSNAFIALSPYVVPFYAVGIILMYWGLRRWCDPPYLFQAFQFLLGGTLAFHLSLTLHAFHGHQTDLKVLGFFLSGVLILLGNGLILGLLGVSLFSRTPTFSQFASGIGTETCAVWRIGLESAKEGIQQMIQNYRLHSKMKPGEPWIR